MVLSLTTHQLSHNTFTVNGRSSMYLLLLLYSTVFIVAKQPRYTTQLSYSALKPAEVAQLILHHTDSNRRAQ